MRRWWQYLVIVIVLVLRLTGSNSEVATDNILLNNHSGDDDEQQYDDDALAKINVDNASFRERKVSTTSINRIVEGSTENILNQQPAIDVTKQPAFLRSGKGRRNYINTNDSSTVFHKALKRAVGGGLPGAIAGIIQVLSLMWLRTVINYQYRYGSSFTQAFTALYGMGGIPRLYSGVSFALIQAPLSRFVSTAANDGVGELLKELNWGPGREVIVASCVVGIFRCALMPIDTMKTVLQIEGQKGLANLLTKVRAGQIHLLYSGVLANAASSFIGHYPWFYTYNLLSRNVMLSKLVPWKTCRNALIGFTSSVISDTVANFMRVLKTSKQALGSTSTSSITYTETLSVIIAVDGWKGLFGRGLKTRILGNALQSILFTVIWRSLSERWTRQDYEEEGIREQEIIGSDIVNVNESSER
jgi:hypothetical protein